MDDDEFDPRYLWRSVVGQAIRDALSTADDYKAVYDRATARAWFDSGSRDFREVCEMAELDPVHVKRSMDDAIRAQDEGKFTSLKDRCASQTRKDNAVRRDRRGRVGAIHVMDGIEDSIGGWAKRVNVPPYSIANRMNSGKAFKVAIQEAVDARKKGRLRGRPVSKG
ncbi:hypothetical protein [Aureimonas sp. D3]|uniref:hypothetical protein n=1 Tax=Aureimonas sp. D3 TaxID=1638164 RepID=UPI0007866ED0|nr:hypothetical protein [Aureimonas sp. D3]